MDIICHNQQIRLLPEKAIFIERLKLLCFSDLHLGRAELFHQRGLPLPPQAIEEDLLHLKRLIEKYSPEIVVSLGDLIHSSNFSKGDDVSSFIDILSAKSINEVILIRGNHEGKKTFLECSSAPIKFLESYLLEGVLFRHIYDAQAAEFQIVGHVHPKTRISINGRFMLSAPCFWLYKNSLTLPAFSSYAGGQNVSRGVKYVIANQEILKID